MGNFIQSIFCCSGDSEDKDHVNKSTKYQSNSSGVNRDLQPTKTSLANNITASNTRSSKPNSSNMKRQQTHQSTQQQIQQHNQQQQQQQQQHQSNTSSNNTYPSHNDDNHLSTKTDVTVYEATDSTIETNNDDAATQTDDFNNNPNTFNDNTRTTVFADKHNDSPYDSSQNYSDGDSGNEADTEVIDDFFDLTKLQPGQSHSSTGWLLETKPKQFKNKKCLILDLDETLVHSSFKYLRQADFVIPVDIDNQLHNVYVIKRPGVDEFMKKVGELYEVVVFTASVSRYGDPLLDALDIHKSVHHRLFRDSCYNYQGNYIKNLSQIGRPLNEIIILDNSPASYIFHPQHAIPISSWFSDAHDNELLDIIPFLEDLSKDNVEDIGIVLDINL